MRKTKWAKGWVSLRRTSVPWPLWPSLAWRRRRFKLLLLWDLLHGVGPPILHEQVPPTVSSRSPYPLPNYLSISLPTCHSSRYSKSFLVSAISLYNSLPQSVSSCSSKISFEQALDRHFASDKFSLVFLEFFFFFFFFLSPVHVWRKGEENWFT